MRYRLLSVGRLKSPFARAGVERYLELLKHLAPSELIEVPQSRSKDPDRRQTEESRRLLAAADGHVIALDERGAAHTSRELAALVDRLAAAGVSRVSLLIGGAEGHAPGLLERADARWQLSRLTLPHELALLLLSEQLYRIETIRAGHPYHRD